MIRLTALILISSALSAGAGLGAEPPPMELEPCSIEEVEDVRAECGRIYVFENREAGAGKIIPIYFIRARARSNDPARDPVFILTGGPGQAASGFATGIVSNSPFLDRRDLVLVDQRGTGFSNALDCVSYNFEERPEAFAELFEIDFFEPSRFRACAERLEAEHDCANTRRALSPTTSTTYGRRWAMTRSISPARPTDRRSRMS